MYFDNTERRKKKVCAKPTGPYDGFLQTQRSTILDYIRKHHLHFVRSAGAVQTRVSITLALSKNWFDGGGYKSPEEWHNFEAN